MTERTPPGRATRTAVTMRCRNRNEIAHSCIGPDEEIRIFSTKLVIRKRQGSTLASMQAHKLENAPSSNRVASPAFQLRLKVDLRAELEIPCRHDRQRVEICRPR